MCHLSSIFPDCQIENTLSIANSLLFSANLPTRPLLINAAHKEYQAASASLREFIVLATDFDRLSQEGYEQEKQFKISEVALQLFNSNFKLGLEYLAQKGYLHCPFVVLLAHL